jgi:predicted phosphohydrolase
MRHRFVWLTDTHLDKVMPWTLSRFINHIVREAPDGLFLTGDISNGILTPMHLKMLATSIECPIYFVLGNHDYHFTGIQKQHAAIRELCKQHPNLIWMTDAGVVRLNEEVCVIGTEGWYDAEEGRPEYLQFTFDWFLTKDFRQLFSMEDRIAFWRKMAKDSAHDIEDKLERAIDQGYKSIYILTHVPPWREATRDVGTFMERFWLPYNTNMRMGRAIEKVMAEHKKRHATVLAGHTHTQASILVSRNIHCIVNEAHYLGAPKNEHIIIL